MSQLYIHENLVRIQPLIYKILCRQESFTLMLTPTPNTNINGISTKTNMSPPPTPSTPLRWGGHDISVLLLSCHFYLTQDESKTEVLKLSASTRQPIYFLNQRVGGRLFRVITLKKWCLDISEQGSRNCPFFSLKLIFLKFMSWTESDCKRISKFWSIITISK